MPPAPKPRTGAPSRALRLAGVLLALGALLFPPAAARSTGPGERASTGRVKSGTGFFVSHDGFVVTSAHVISGCQNVAIWRRDGTRRPAYPIAFDRRRDIALLWAEATTSNQTAAVTRLPRHSGEEVYTLGYGVVASQPLNPVLVEGLLVGDRTARAGNRIVVFRGTLHAGHSGAAVLAGDGSLLGMVIGRDEEYPGFGVAIPKEDVESLASAYGIQLARRGPAIPARDFLAAISVLVQCMPAGSAGATSDGRARPR